MAQEAELVTAADKITLGLRSFVDNTERENIRVIVSSHKQLHAFIGSNRFKDMGSSQRQNDIWKFLRKTVDDQYLKHCNVVYTMDVLEFETFIREVQLEALQQPSIDIDGND